MFPEAAHRRCTVHFYRNVMARVPKCEWGLRHYLDVMLVDGWPYRMAVLWGCRKVCKNLDGTGTVLMSIPFVRASKYSKVYNGQNVRSRTGAGMAECIAVLGSDYQYNPQLEDDYTQVSDNEALPREETRAFCTSIAMRIVDMPIEPGKVISIYGIGGQGKTYLLEELYSKFESAHSAASQVACHNFLVDNASSPEEILKELAEILEARDIPCPSFRRAYYAWYSRAKNEIAAKETFLADMRTATGSGTGAFLSILETSSPFIDWLASLTDPFAAIQGFPACSLLTVALRLLESARRGLEQNRRSDEWHRLVYGESERSLRESLPERLKEDIESWVERTNKRLVFFLDTFEKLGWQNGGWMAGRYGWAKTLTQARGPLWIVAGRQRLAWENVVYLPLHLMEMSHDESETYLIQEGVEDSSMRDEMRRVSGGIPVYLSLCVELFHRDSDFVAGSLADALNAEGLIDLYFRNISCDLQDALYAAAFLEYWDVSFLLEACSGVVTAGTLDRLPFVSFIRKRESRFEIHEVIAEILRRSRNIGIVKRCLFDNLSRMLVDIERDRTHSYGSRLAKKRHVLKSLTLLADVGVDGKNEEDYYRVYMAYAECVWANGDIDLAYSLFDSVRKRFDTSDIPSKYYLRAKLKVAAIMTQRWLYSGDRKHHEDAIATTEEVLQSAKEHYPDDRDLIWSIENDLGISWKRFGEFDKAFEHLNPMIGQIARELEDREVMSVDRARYLNNYGAVCQQFADTLSDVDERSAWYMRAREMYEKSYEGRSLLLGEQSSQALLSLTNEGVAYARLGDYASATKCFDKALAGYVEGEFATSDAFYLRCRFQHANMLEAKAKCLLADDCWEDALAVANSACEEHMAVHADRVDAMSEYALDSQKSAGAVVRCEQLVDRIKSRGRSIGTADLATGLSDRLLGTGEG